MKKQAVILIALLSIICSLAYLVVMFRRHTIIEPPVGQFVSEAIDVLNLKAPISEITFSPPEESEPFTLAVDSEQVDGETPKVIILGHEELPINVSRTSLFFIPHLKLLASQIVYDQVDDYSLYGVTEPYVSIKFMCEDGISKTLLIGNITPDGDHYYVKIKDESLIYAVPSFRLLYYIMQITGFIDTTVTESMQLNSPEYVRITLGGWGREEFGNVVLAPSSEIDDNKENSYNYSLCFPIVHPIDNQYGEKILSSLFNLSAYSVVSAYPNETQLADYGLDIPYSTLEAESDENHSFTLIASEPNGAGWVYLMREDVPLVYRVMESEVPWLDIQFYDLMERRVFPVSIDNVDSINGLTISIDNRDYDFTLDHSNPTGMVAYMNGQQVGMGRFTILWEALESVLYEECTLSQQTEDLDCYLSVIIRYSSGDTDKSASFYPSSSRRYLIKSNDMDFLFFTSSFYIDSVISQCKALDKL